MADEKLRLVLEALWKGKGVSDATKDLDKMRGGGDRLMGSLKKLAVGLGLGFGLAKFVGMAKDAAIQTVKLAGRFSTLEVVVNRLGQNIGMSSAQMRLLEMDMMKTGISALGTREAIAKMVGAELDLAQATDLARVAQNAAVIQGENSTDTFMALVDAVQAGNVRMLRQRGIFTNFMQAYDEWADANNRAVASLTDTEKAQIRLNAVLKAGEQITGTYEAAMGSWEKQMASLTGREIPDLMTSVGTFADQLLSTGVPAVRAMISAITDLAEIQELTGDTTTSSWEAIAEGLGIGGQYIIFAHQSKAAIEAGIITQEEYLGIITRLQSGNLDLGGAIKAVSTAVDEAKEAHLEYLASVDAQDFAQASGLMAEKVAVMADASDNASTSFRVLGGESEEARKRVLDMASAAADEVAPAVDSMGQAIGRAASAVDVGLSGSISRFMEQMAFFAGGGAEIQGAFEATQEALLAGKITPEQAQEFAGELFVAAEDLQVDLGNITSNEAAKNIRDELGGSLTDAKSKLDEIDSGLLSLPDRIEIEIAYITTGGDIFGTGVTGGATDDDGQHGRSFVVPPGFPRDSFRMGLTSGEHVQVGAASQQVTNNDQRMQGMSVSINTPLDLRTFDTMMRQWAGL